MPHILVTYASKSGSTAEVAEAVAKTVREGSADVTVQPVGAVTALDDYDAVIVGTPMIFGWHRDAATFVQRFHTALSSKPVAYFIMCYDLTRTGEPEVKGIPLTLDPKLGQPPRNPSRLSFPEKMKTPAHYLDVPLDNAPNANPVSVAFFRGKMDYSKLGPLPGLFMRLVFRAKGGDYRNWDAINAWAAEVGEKLTSA